jgi:AraC-like DNA-binding protein
MSRTAFAVYFRQVAGVPPLAYLGRWRISLAKRALLDGAASQTHREAARLFVGERVQQCVQAGSRYFPDPLPP